MYEAASLLTSRAPEQAEFTILPSTMSHDFRSLHQPTIVSKAEAISNGFFLNSKPKVKPRISVFIFFFGFQFRYPPLDLTKNERLASKTTPPSERDLDKPLLFTLPVPQKRLPTRGQLFCPKLG